MNMTPYEVILSGAVDLNVTIAELARVIRSVFGEKFLLHTQLDPKLGRIDADARTIDRLLVSLVINAQDPASPRGEITISTANLDLDEEAAEELHLSSCECVQVEVMIGHSRVGDLGTVRDLVRQTRGAVSVRTSPEKGSTVMILLPRAANTQE